MARWICTWVSTLSLAAAVIMTATAQAQPTVVEPGWTLIRTINFDNPQAAHCNPVNGLLYVGRQDTSSDGLYRIDRHGFATLLASGDCIAAVVVDPDDGDIFVSEDHGGNIYRTEFGGTGRETWVTGFHSGDDDPAGMAIAPNDYSGNVVAPGEALVVDWGNVGPDEVWRWSPDTPEGETMVHADDGTPVASFDIAIGQSDVYLVDTGGSSNGVIYQLATDGTLTALPTSAPIADPVGLTFDPLTGDLFVLDAGADRLVRVVLGTGELSDVFTGFALSTAHFAGVDVTADGRQVVVTDGGYDAIHVFALCDAEGTPELDCNGNGTVDGCDIALATSTDCNDNGIPDECDLASGTSGDCDNNGIPDECPVCPPLDVVFVMDTSNSMIDEGEALCNTIDQIIAALQTVGVDTQATLLAISGVSSGCNAFSCLPDTVIGVYGSAVPGSPPPGLETLGDCPGSPEVPCEDWGLATAVVAGLHPWLPDAIRVVVPLGDEGPWCGDPVTEMDEDSITHAIAVALDNGVICSPITGTGSDGSVIALAQQLAAATGGTHFSSSQPDADIAQAIVNLVVDACSAASDCNGNGVPDTCDIDDGTSLDVNGNGIPDECDCPGDLNSDFQVDLSDLAALLANYGTTTGMVYLDGDLDLDGDVDLADLATLLGAYGEVCE